MPLFLAFLAVPLIEIALFVQVGGWIGLWPTLAIVIATAIAGSVMVRSQGSRALADLRRAFDTLGDPTLPLAEGATILFAGALLLTPGFFTDTLGLALLLPPVRRAALRALARRVTVARFRMGGAAQQPPRQPPARPRDDIVEGDWREIDAETRENGGPSPWQRH